MTPELTHQDVLNEHHYIFTQVDSINWNIHLNLTLRSEQMMSYRYYKNENDLEKLNQFILEQIKLKGFKLENWIPINDHRDSLFVGLSIAGHDSNLVRQIGNFKVINPCQVITPKFEDPIQRENKVRINVPKHEFYTKTFNFISLESKIIDLPEPADFKSKFGSYYTSFSRVNDGITIVENFALNAQDISLNEYQEFHSFIDQINTYQKKTAIVIK